MRINSKNHRFYWADSVIYYTSNVTTEELIEFEKFVNIKLHRDTDHMYRFEYIAKFK